MVDAAADIQTLSVLTFPPALLDSTRAASLLTHRADARCRFVADVMRLDEHRESHVRIPAGDERPRPRHFRRYALIADGNQYYAVI